MTDARQFIERNLDPAEAPRPTVRFSLMGMMVVMSVLAVICAVVFALPPSVGAILCIFLQPCLLAACVIGAFYARDDLRAFCVGALVPFAQSVLPGGGGMSNWSNYLTVMLTQRSMSTARRRNSTNESLFDFMGNIYNMLENIGPTLMLTMFVFVFASLSCGFTGMLVRRWITRRTTSPPE